jgi:transcriptional regulator with XRE-family HTH domain
LRPSILSPSGDQGRPTHVQELLGSRLRTFRIATGMDQKTAAERLPFSASTLSRIENGQLRIEDVDLVELFDLYGVTGADERRAWRELNRHLNARKWWDSYSDAFADWYCSYLVWESAAKYIWTYECTLIPGLLQTQDYAEAIIRTKYTDDEHVRRLVEVRMRRQETVLRTGTPQLWAIVDPRALTDGVEDPAIMRKQIEFLIEASDFTGVTIQVLRPRPGLCAWRNDSFSILRFPNINLPDVVYLENLDSAHFLDGPERAEPYREAMNRIGTAARPPEQTRQTLEHVLERLDRT